MHQRRSEILQQSLKTLGDKVHTYTPYTRISVCSHFVASKGGAKLPASTRAPYKSFKSCESRVAQFIMSVQDGIAAHGGDDVKNTTFPGGYAWREERLRDVEGVLCYG